MRMRFYLGHGKRTKDYSLEHGQWISGHQGGAGSPASQRAGTGSGSVFLGGGKYSPLLNKGRKKPGFVGCVCLPTPFLIGRPDQTSGNDLW